MFVTLVDIENHYQLGSILFTSVNPTRTRGTETLTEGAGNGKADPR